MKMISLWLLVFTLAVGAARGQDAGTQQQFNELNGRIQAILDTQELQGKQLAALQKQLSDLSDKVNTPAYFEWALRRSRPGALIVADNVVRGGSLADADDPDPATRAQRSFHEQLATDARVEATTIQTVGGKGYDGFTVTLVLDA